MSTPASLSVEFDLTPVERQIEEVQRLLESLPDSLREGLRSSVADLSDFVFETETLPATAAGTYVVRVRSVALADLCAAALWAAN